MKRLDSVYSSVGNFLTLVKPDAKFKEDVNGKDTYILNPKNPVLPAAAEVQLKTKSVVSPTPGFEGLVKERVEVAASA